MFAVDRGHVEVVRTLLDANAGCGIDKSPLQMMAFLAVSADSVGRKNNRGQSALEIAAIHDNIRSNANSQEIIKLLVNFYAENGFADCKDLLSWAFIKEKFNSSLIDSILSNPKIDINERNAQGNTALIEAVRSENIGLAIELINCGRVDVNAVGADGWTALMYAAQNGCFEVTRLLLQNGADVKAVNSDGNTAMMIADKNGYSKIVRKLSVKTAQLRRYYGESLIRADRKSVV